MCIRDRCHKESYSGRCWRRGRRNCRLRSLCRTEADRRRSDAERRRPARVGRGDDRHVTVDVYGRRSHARAEMRLPVESKRAAAHAPFRSERTSEDEYGAVRLAVALQRERSCVTGNQCAECLGARLCDERGAADVEEEVSLANSGARRRAAFRDGRDARKLVVAPNRHRSGAKSAAAIRRLAPRALEREPVQHWTRTTRLAGKTAESNGPAIQPVRGIDRRAPSKACLLYTSDAADERSSV